MTTLTKHPAKTVKPYGADRIGDVHYWNGKPLPPIFYEDPEPVEDGMLQADTILRIVEALMRRFPKDFVKGGGFVMYNPEDGNDRFAPDGYISFGVTREHVQEALRLRNYYIWAVEKGIDFALEVASPSTADNDTGFKRRLYAELGVGEYWLLDATGDLYGKPITGLRLVNGRYEECEIHEEADGSLRSYSEMLGLEFWWLIDADPADPFDLRDPLTGKSICAGEMIADERYARVAAERRAEDAELRVESEREGRLAAEREARELRRRLDELEGRGE